MKPDLTPQPAGNMERSRRVSVVAPSRLYSTRRHVGERFTLYRADAVDVLEDIEPRSVGCIATDPPYGVQWQSSYRKKAKQFAPIVGDDGSLDVLGILGQYVRQTLMPSRHVYVFGSTGEQLREPLQLGGVCDLIWDKGMVGLGDLEQPWGPQHEMIGFGVYIPSKQNRTDGRGALAAHLRAGSVLRVDRPNSQGVRRHPTEKPVELMRRIIESSSVVGDTILDMFAGSGSTLVAAILSGRKTIGIEVTETHFETALARCLKAEEIWRDMGDV